MLKKEVKKIKVITKKDSKIELSKGKKVVWAVMLQKKKKV